MQTTVEIRAYRDSDEQAVIGLWQTVFPDAPAWNDPASDIRRKLTVQPGLFLVAERNGELIGTVMGGFDGHRGWVYYLVVDPDHRRQGIGAALMRHVEDGLRSLGCHKLNLQVRATNHEVVEFYKRLGYDVEQRVSMGKRLTES